MKIGIVTEYFFPTLGGITENIYHMSLRLLALGHDLRIITGQRDGLPPIDDEIRRRMIYVGKSTNTFFNGSCGSITRGLGLTAKMREVLISENFDIIHLHSPLFPTLPMIANMQANAPLTATYHTCTDNTLLYRLFGKILQKLTSRIDANIAVSKCCAEDNNRFFDIDFSVIPNGVDVSWWTEDTKKIEEFDDDFVNILFIGRPDTRNGLDTLIHAFEIAHEKHPKTRLIIVGDGPLKFYFENLVSSSIKDAVHFVGSATDKRRNYMATADIMCFTPDIASFGITILEGMSGGKAMIASDIEPFRDLVTDEESALLVNPRDINAHATALERLIVDDDLRETLGGAALRRVDRYDWKRVTDLHIKLYEKILKPV